MQSPLSKIPFSMDSSSSVPQKCQAILSTWAICSGHALRVRQYRVLWTGLCLMVPQRILNLSVKKGRAAYSGKV